MNTYTLKTVEESTISGGTISTTYYTIPVDNSNIPITDYHSKFRVIVDNQMLVFDTEQEYRDWIQQNS